MLKLYIALLNVYVFVIFSYFIIIIVLNNYLRQVNELNGGDNAFVCVCLSVCVSVLSGRSWELNDNSSKTVKAQT